MKILSLVGRVKSRIRRLQESAKRRANIDRKYLVGGIPITLPSEHKLPETQLIYPLYDKFLPFITRELNANSIVLDVGANVGDSLAAMAASNHSLKYVCVEAEPLFLEYLNLNIRALVEALPELQVQVVSRMISSTPDRKILVGGDGTRKGELNDEIGLLPVSIDTLCEENGFKNISLIKSDVDGWDWDVISSAFQVIKRDKPVLFFEMMVIDSSMLSDYSRLLKKLNEHGYSDFYIFDCFGAFMFHTTNVGLVSEFGDYLLTQYKSKTARVIYYIDIMCGVADDPVMRRSIDSYLSWISNDKS